MSYHLRLFGHPALLDADGAMHRFRSRKQLALLVYLTLEAVEDPVERGVLIDFFWADVPLQKGRHSLSQALTAIRSLLGAEALPREPGPVRLSRPPSTDLDILRGELDGELANLQLPLRDLEQAGGAAFADWLDQAREHCLGTARRSLSGRLRAARSSGDVHRVHERAAQLYAVDPLNEMAVCALAEQLLMDGDVAGTQDFLRSHISRARARWELPPPAVVHLLERVETGRIRPPGGELLSATSSGQGVPQLFVGRSTELARLESLWADARRGRLVTCLVTGLAGIGKSSLLRRFAISVAARAAAVWEVACQEIGRSIPFAAISDLIHSVTRDSAVTGTSPDWLAEASRVCPGLREVYSGMPEPPPTPAESVRLRVAEALVQMQAAAADGGPMLFAIDDIANLDAASRDVLHVFLRRLQDVPVLVVACSRTSVTQSPASSLSDPTSGLDWNEVLALPPLSQDHSEILVGQILGSGRAPDISQRETLLKLAAGNPYLIEMLTSDWLTNGPQSLVAVRSQGEASIIDWHPPRTLHRAFQNLYRGLSKCAQRCIHLLAVAGRRITVSEISALLDLTPGEVDASVLELLDRAVLRVDEGHLAFKNQLHRDYVYAAMSRELRRFHHMQIARSQHPTHERPDFQQHLEASLHYDMAGSLDLAIHHAVAGARVAIERGAPEEAEGAIRRLLPHSGRQEARLQLLLAEAQLVRGEHQSALSTIGSINSQGLAPSEMAQRLVLQAEALHRDRTADPDVVAGAAREALAVAQVSEEDAIVLRALQVSAEVAHETAQMHTIESILQSVSRMAGEPHSVAVQASAAITKAFCLMVTGQYHEAAHLFASGESGFRSASRDVDLRRALNGRGICLTTLGDWNPAIDCLQEAASLAHRIGDSHSESIQWDNLAVLYEDIGWFDRAVEALQRAASLLKRAPSPQRKARLLANAASLAITLGNFLEATEFLEQAVALTRGLQAPTLTISTLVACADLHIAQKDYETAWTWADEAVSYAQKHAERARKIGDYERVRRHFVWATQGYTAFLRAKDETENCLPELRRSQLMELTAFEEWVDRTEGRETRRGSVTQEMEGRELLGAIAHLVALHIYPRELPERLPGETSAQLVKRAFPQCRCQSVPTSVGALL
jgi:DNA-binding SARP family transcriptional activator/tetratricopeptide (TPR) repeat protein